MPIPAIIAPLLKGGLSLLANAALVRGKEWVKEKTGVDLAAGEMRPEDLAKLKQFELENEVELARLAHEENKLGIELERAYLADIDSARKMQTAALQQEDTFSKRFVYYFAIFWAVVVSTYVACITFMDIPEANVRYADTILGFLLGTLVAQIIGFFYGSSRSSQRKDDVIGQVVSRVGGR